MEEIFEPLSKLRASTNSGLALIECYNDQISLQTSQFRKKLHPMMVQTVIEKSLDFPSEEFKIINKIDQKYVLKTDQQRLMAVFNVCFDSFSKYYFNPGVTVSILKDIKIEAPQSH